MEDHPIITGAPSSRRPGPPGPPGPPPPFHHPRHYHHHHGPPPPPPPQAAAAQSEAQNTEAAASNEKGKAKEKQAYVEDPPEVDPSTVKPAAASDEKRCRGREMPGSFPFRGRGPCGEGQEGAEGPHARGGPGCRGRGGHRGQFGPPPFMMGGGPWWARRAGGPPGPHGPHGPQGPRPEGAPEHEGPGPHRGWMRGGPGGCGRRGRHGPPGGSPPRGGPNFNLGDFLNKLGERLGVDLSGASEALGGGLANRFSGPRNNNETDFEPRADIFDTPESFLVHLSLPGAKKEDVGVDWDGENSVLHIAGVVHRPGVDEKLLSQLVVDGRKRETGVFERAVRLGTRRDPASIDVAGIKAKMMDGVLVVTVPKVEAKHEKREVPISNNSSATSSPARAVESEKEKEAHNEKQRDLLFDADEDMHDAPAANNTTTTTTAYTASLPHQPPAHETSNEKRVEEMERQQELENEKEKEKHRDDRSETMDHEEALPSYEVEEFHDEASDWEKYGSDDEGDYVKITVD